MKIGDVLFLKSSMPFGFGPDEMHKEGAEATILNMQDYHGTVPGNLLYVEFANGVRTWIHNQWFKDAV